MHRIFLYSLIAAVCAFSAGAGAEPAKTSKVNGSIEIAADQQAGALSTVNGAIRVGDGASAGDISTVNGSITLGDRTRAESIDTVNGSITLGAGANVAKAITAVNGSARLDKGAEVSAGISNVNGRIALEAAHVGGRIETVGGDIEIGADSRVDGGILVQKPSGWSFGFSRKPRIVIGPRAEVGGNLEFKRDVELYVSDSAKIGPVTGATVEKFSGEGP
ncbi:MAG: hypothetical protein J0H15_08655 [Xanthomonadales bacterium]|nr:hypothetical protein [Xanthomonadales bacterium]